MRGPLGLVLRQGHRLRYAAAAPSRHVHQFLHPLSPSTVPKSITSSIPVSHLPNLRFSSSSSSDGGGDGEASSPPPEDAAGSAVAASSDSKEVAEASAADLVEDVSNAELKQRIEKYFKGDEEALPSIMEAILRRRLTGKHEETDDELMEELRMRPLQDVKDQEFEEDFDELYSTDEEIPDLYNARNHVEQKMVKDEYFNMDERKWDDMVQEAVEKGFVKGTGECERILEDMLKWDTLLPDEIKQKVEAKFHELGDMCERGELQPEEAYELFKEFEDKVVLECAEMMEAKEYPEEHTADDRGKKEEPDDPPGKGPILRWETRAVFAPGGDSWHPKNRKVKLSVTVKELGLSRHAFRRLREVVGKRYHPGRDELVLISERFEHREENRKDCLRTLYALIDDARTADKLVEEARNAYVKDRLKANTQFMERLHTKLATSAAPL